MIPIACRRVVITVVCIGRIFLVTAVEEIAELVDPESDIRAYEPVVGRVVIGARVAQAAAPGADARGFAAIHQIEADAVGAVAGVALRIAFIGDGFEGDLYSRARRERRTGRDDRALLMIAARVAVGEAQSALTIIIGNARRRTAWRRSRAQIALLA